MFMSRSGREGRWSGLSKVEIQVYTEQRGSGVAEVSPGGCTGPLHGGVAVCHHLCCGVCVTRVGMEEGAAPWSMVSPIGNANSTRSIVKNWRPDQECMAWICTNQFETGSKHPPKMFGVYIFYLCELELLTNLSSNWTQFCNGRSFRVFNANVVITLMRLQRCNWPLNGSWK